MRRILGFKDKPRTELSDDAQSFLKVKYLQILGRHVWTFQVMARLNRCHGAKKKICVTTLEVRVMGLFMKAPAAIKFQYGFQMLKIKGQVLTQAQ